MLTQPKVANQQKKGPTITSELQTAQAHALYLWLLPFLAQHTCYSNIYKNLIRKSLGAMVGVSKIGLKQLLRTTQQNSERVSEREITSRLKI